MERPLEDVMNARLYLVGTGNDRFKRGGQPAPSRQYLGYETLRQSVQTGLVSFHGQRKYSDAMRRREEYTCCVPT